MKQKRGRVSDGEQDHDDDYQEIFICKSDAARDRARMAKKRANQHRRVFISVSSSSFASEWALRNKGGDFNVAARYGTYGEGVGDGVLEKEWQTLTGKAIFYTDCDAIKCLIEEGVDLEQPCAYQVERVTCEGPVMLMYRPLTYAVRHDIPEVTRMLLNRRVNRTHAPTDVFPELQVSRYDRSMEMLGRYDAWLSCMYATLWTTRYLVKEHGWRDVGPIIVSMIELEGDHAWLADVANVNVRYW